MTEWFDAQHANLVGGILGGVIGTVAGGVGGPLMGFFAPKGRAKGLVVGFHIFWVATGVGLLATAAVAALQEQPGYVIHPFLLVGTVTTAVMGGLLPVTLMRYREAERRKLDAEELRRG